VQSIDEVRIKYSIDGGNNWIEIDEAASADGLEGSDEDPVDGSPDNDGRVENDGSYKWTIPDAIASSGTTTQVLLLIEDHTNPYVPAQPTEGIYDICDG